MTHRFLAILALCAALLNGCQMSRAGKGAAVGGALGGVAGAVIGHQTGHDLAGAAIGVASGAVAGGLVGHAADARADRDEALAQAERIAAQHNVWNRAVASDDVLHMVDSGLSDDLIVDTLKSRGSRFDPKPENIVYLKNRGVSEAVIRALQTYSVPYPPSSVAREVSMDFPDE